jgi:hypothetical protein
MSASILVNFFANLALTGGFHCQFPCQFVTNTSLVHIPHGCEILLLKRKILHNLKANIVVLC